MGGGGTIADQPPTRLQIGRASAGSEQLPPQPTTGCSSRSHHRHPNRRPPCHAFRRARAGDFHARPAGPYPTLASQGHFVGCADPCVCARARARAASAAQQIESARAAPARAPDSLSRAQMDYNMPVAGTRSAARESENTEQLLPPQADGEVADHRDDKTAEMPELGPYIVDRLCRHVPAPMPTEPWAPPAGPFEQLPRWMHVGKWSPAAYMFFSMIAVALSVLSAWALGEQQREVMRAAVAHTAGATQGMGLANWLRVAGGIWGSVVLLGMFKTVGWWPMISYTMQSWLLLSVRLLCSACAHLFTCAAWGAELLRYTALLQTTIVVVAWWLVICPAIMLSEQHPGKRRAFCKWNCSFALINVHLLNLPVAGADFLSDPRALTLMDVWIVLVAAFIYIFFYTTILDRRGILLYFVFSPRTHFCWLVYTTAVVVMCGLLWFWAKLGGKGVDLHV
eukprot:COSAG02_NODE_433_length_22435_cov_151.224078_18_plen_453_part_00